MKKLLPGLFILISTYSSAQSETVDFESSPQYVSIDSLTGCWQIGTPSKTIFNAAYSGSHALITDTVNNYPDGTVSYAYFTFPTQGMSSSYNLTFYHEYDTETNVDGGYIEIFDCFSSSWVNVSTGSGMPCPTYQVTYSQNGSTGTLFNSESGYTGSSGGWVESMIDFGCIALVQNNINRGGGNTQFRFVFVSDGNTTASEGWMIDNIVWTDNGGFCVGIKEYENQLQLSVYPTQTDSKISFETEHENFSVISIFDFSGKMIENYSFSPTNFKTLQLSQLATGMYFYSVDDGKATGKFIIEE